MLEGILRQFHLKGERIWHFFISFKQRIKSTDELTQKNFQSIVALFKLLSSSFLLPISWWNSLFFFFSDPRQQTYFDRPVLWCSGEGLVNCLGSGGRQSLRRPHMNFSTFPTSSSSPLSILDEDNLSPINQMRSFPIIKTCFQRKFWKHVQ